VAWGLVPPTGRQVETVVQEQDRHALRILRAAGVTIAHHASDLFSCQPSGAADDDVLFLHFPTTPPLDRCFSEVVARKVGRHRLPVVDLDALAMAHLLSRRSGSLDAVRTVLASGKVDLPGLTSTLAQLDALPVTTSAYVLLRFDRALAHRRLAQLAAP
jgi:hypothetical protein